jgi:DNA-binding transcriptional regulator of glucitol operon
MSIPRRRRVGLVLGVIVAAAGCLALGWWQWTRFESTSGSFQNLGYALQWPMFAAFCVYAYRKFIRLESAPEHAGEPDVVTEIPAGLLPERPSAPREAQDTTMREYNAYLAALADNDRADRDRADQDRTTA